MTKLILLDPMPHSYWHRVFCLVELESTRLNGKRLDIRPPFLVRRLGYSLRCYSKDSVYIFEALEKEFGVELDNAARNVLLYAHQDEWCRCLYTVSANLREEARAMALVNTTPRSLGQVVE